MPAVARFIRRLTEPVQATQGLFSTIVSDEEVTLDLRAKLDQAIIDETIATQIIDGFQDVNKATNLQTHAGFPLESVFNPINALQMLMFWHFQGIFRGLLTS